MRNARETHEKKSVEGTGDRQYIERYFLSYSKSRSTALSDGELNHETQAPSKRFGFHHTVAARTLNTQHGHEINRSQ